VIFARARSLSNYFEVIYKLVKISIDGLRHDLVRWLYQVGKASSRPAPFFKTAKYYALLVRQEDRKVTIWQIYKGIPTSIFIDSNNPTSDKIMKIISKSDFNSIRRSFQNKAEKALYNGNIEISDLSLFSANLWKARMLGLTMASKSIQYQIINY